MITDITITPNNNSHVAEHYNGRHSTALIDDLDLMIFILHSTFKMGNNTLGRWKTARKMRQWH